GAGLPQGRPQDSLAARVQEPDHARDAGDPHDPRRGRRSGRAVRRQGGGPGAAPAGDPGSGERGPRRGRRPHRGDANPSGKGHQGDGSQAAGQAGAGRTRALARVHVPRAEVRGVRVGVARGEYRGATVRGHHASPAGRVMMRLPPFSYLAPVSVGDAVKLSPDHGPEAMLVAGGTDLYPNMKRRQFEPTVLVGLRGIKDLSGVRRPAGGGLAIGAGTTLTTVSRHPEVRSKYAALATAAGAVSTPQLRNMGTVGGNVCVDTRCNYYNQSYQWRKAVNFCMKKDGEICLVAPGSPRCWAVSSSDTAPVLWSLGARVRIAGPAGERTIPISALYQDDGIQYLTKQPGEIVTEIVLPAADDVRSVYLKLRRRGSFDFPVLGVAAGRGVVGGGVW